MKWLLKLVARNARRVHVTLVVLVWIDDRNNPHVRLYTSRTSARREFAELEQGDNWGVTLHTFSLSVAELLDAQGLTDAASRPTESS